MTKPVRVLLVEDSRAIGDVICRALRSGGYDVEEHRVRSPEALGNAVAATQWDVIIANRAIHALSVSSTAGTEEAGLTRSASHDFNNLLTSIIGAADLSLGVPGLPDEVRADLAAIRAAGRQAADLTRELGLAVGPKETHESAETDGDEPEAREGDGRDDATDATAGLRHGQEAILVVEDEPRLRSVICRSLEQLGYEVLEAEHGEDALRVLHKHRAPVQLLVTDLVMPEMGGSELGRLLHNWYPNVRVLFVSGHGPDSATSDPELMRQSSYLPKPFTIEQLADCVRELLDRPLG